MQHSMLKINLERNSKLAPAADRPFAYTGCWDARELHR